MTETNVLKKRCNMIVRSDWIQLFQIIKTNIDICWCHIDFLR